MPGLEISRWPQDQPLEMPSVAEVWAHEGFNCDLWVDPPGQQWLDFVHQTDERVAVKERRVEFEVEGMRAMLGPGDTVLFPPAAATAYGIAVRPPRAGFMATGRVDASRAGAWRQGSQGPVYHCFKTKTL